MAVDVEVSYDSHCSCSFCRSLVRCFSKYFSQSSLSIMIKTMARRIMARIMPISAVTASFSTPKICLIMSIEYLPL